MAFLGCAYSFSRREFSYRFSIFSIHLYLNHHVAHTGTMVELDFFLTLSEHVISLGTLI